MLVFNLEFLAWVIGLLAVEAFLTYVFVLDLFRHWAVPIAMAAGLVVFAAKWMRQFLVRMIVDYDANNGDGRVVIQRLIPSPNLPETVQFPLQQAAEGSPEVNTHGVINTLISQLKVLKFLRHFTIGDLTLRGPAAPFGITMYNIMDPGGVKSKLEQDWKKIAAIKNKEKAEKERAEEVARIKEGVLLGIREALITIKEEFPPLAALPAGGSIVIRHAEDVADTEGVAHLKETDSDGDEELADLAGGIGEGAGGEIQDMTSEDVPIGTATPSEQ